MIYVHIYNCTEVSTVRISLVAQMVKRLSTMWETWVQSLGWEDSLEKEMATHPILLPRKSHGWKIPFHGVSKSRTQLSNFTSLAYKGKKVGK